MENINFYSKLKYFLPSVFFYTPIFSLDYGTLATPIYDSKDLWKIVDVTPKYESFAQFMILYSVVYHKIKEILCKLVLK